MDKISIYTIMSMTNLEKDAMTGMPYFGSTSCPGFYTNSLDAFEAVKNNNCDIFETCYKYALIEEVEEGMYGLTPNRWWFEYNLESGLYEEIEEPEYMKNYGGFTIG